MGGILGSYTKDLGLRVNFSTFLPLPLPVTKSKFCECELWLCLQVNNMVFKDLAWHSNKFAALISRRGLEVSKST
jgi:hypothetical protein